MRPAAANQSIVTTFSSRWRARSRSAGVGHRGDPVIDQSGESKRD
jgi:hypothetical protein